MAASSISVSAPRFSNKYFLQAMRVIWWILAILGGFLFLYLLPINFDIFTRMPATVASDAVSDMELSVQFLEGLRIIGIPPPLYAGIKILFGFITVSIFYGVGYLIFRFRFDERIGMIAAFCFIGMGGFIGFMANYQPEPGTMDYFIANQLGSMIAITGWGGFYLFLILYPDGRFKPIWSIISPLIWLSSIIVSLIPNSPLNFFDDGTSDGSIQVTVIVLLMFGIPIVAQVYRYFRLFTQLQRQQVKWFLLALAWLFISLIIDIFRLSFGTLEPVNIVIFDILNALFTLSFALLPIAVGIAILRYRLWDIDLVINKSLVYGIFLGMALAVFTVILASLQIIIGESQPLPALLIALVVSAILFKPAQNRIQHFVDRYLYRLNFDLNELAAAQKAREITKPGVLTGKIISGYELGNLIGKGGMGEIYKGFSQDKTVAIKTLLPELTQDKELLTRFQREVETGKRLNHRNIAEVFDNGTIDGTPYLIMEYIEGQDLHSILKREGVFDEETTRHIIQNICSALAVVHAEGYVHRDLKPANIMLRENGEAVLMDFGISKAKVAHTITGTGAIGTIDYMAPEQIMSAKEVDHRADIYALGVMLYEMLTGEKPFTGGAAQVMFAHLQQPVPDVREKDDTIPLVLADAIEKAMAKDPDERFQSVSEFGAALSL